MHYPVPLALVLVLGGAASASEKYPRVVTKPDGTTCIQSLDSDGAVTESCRAPGRSWDSAVTRRVDGTEKRPADAPTRHDESSLLTPYSRMQPRNASGLSPEVASAIKSAQAKAGWSSTLLWSGFGIGLGGAVMLGAGMQTDMQAIQAEGLIFIGAGVAFAAVGALLGVSANSDIDLVTRQ